LIQELEANKHQLIAVRQQLDYTSFSPKIIVVIMTAIKQSAVWSNFGIDVITGLIFSLRVNIRPEPAALSFCALFPYNFDGNFPIISSKYSYAYSLPNPALFGLFSGLGAGVWQSPGQLS
jgi:hypothetical protein